jgi:hypothetical protein
MNDRILNLLRSTGGTMRMDQLVGCVIPHGDFEYDSILKQILVSVKGLSKTLRSPREMIHEPFVQAIERLSTIGKPPLFGRDALLGIDSKESPVGSTLVGTYGPSPQLSGPRDGSRYSRWRYCVVA